MGELNLNMCPDCGSDAKLFYPTPHGAYVVRCSDADCFACTHGYKTAEDAALAWNLGDTKGRPFQEAQGYELMPVIRCKNCAKQFLHTCPLSVVERASIGFINRPMDWYCADAEPKKEGEDDG